MCEESSLHRHVVMPRITSFAQEHKHSGVATAQ